mmetsp:Transcript_3953/g.9358  ORF Transcript_3953/g.9358 Transcript_3953/m.9358 type:complete len:201 (-) Transcript_3953:212-814(-)
MGERKVLNRYFPPDFDPLLVPKRKYDPYKQVEVRMMIPFSLQCIKCGEYMYRGKKFNSRKEDVIGDDYLGIKKYRFYIKCCVCNNEIAFKTDPKNQDYVCESGLRSASWLFAYAMRLRRESSGPPARHRRDTLRRRHAQLRVLAPAGRGRGEVRGRAEGGRRGERDVRARVEDAGLEDRDGHLGRARRDQGLQRAPRARR